MSTPSGLSALLPASIKGRILLFVVCFEITAYGTIVLFNNYVYKNALIEQKSNEIKQTFTASVGKINHARQLMERNVIDLANFGEHLYQIKQTANLSLKTIGVAAEQTLVRNFSEFEQAIGGGIWYEPYLLDKQTRYFGPYAYREGKEVLFSWDLNTPEYDYLNQDWYTIATVNEKVANKIAKGSASGQRIFWTEPYYDQAATFSLMMTVDGLMFDHADQHIGMATVDWSMAQLTTFIDSVKVSDNAWPFLIYQGEGKFLSFPKDKSRVLQGAEQFDWGQKILADQRQDALFVLPNWQIDNQLYNIYYFRTPAGFVFGSLMPLSDFNRSISTITTITLLAGGGIGSAFIVLMVLWLRRLFSPFDEVLQRIQKSITRLPDDKHTVVITP
ncbi:MAG: hypothetical protein ACI8WB_003838, partial [Phenylobacterium sp.]